MRVLTIGPRRPGRGWARGLRLRHSWTCRHCQMVEEYRLQRGAELRLAEGLHRQDERYPRPITFKEWLERFEWERDPATA